MGGPSPYHAEKQDRGLSDFFESIAHGPCLAKEELFNVAEDRFGITLGFV